MILYTSFGDSCNVTILILLCSKIHISDCFTNPMLIFSGWKARSHDLVIFVIGQAKLVVERNILLDQLLFTYDVLDDRASKTGSYFFFPCLL